ncbi:MAG: hypothetical protein ACJAVF_001205 [Paraglaciecola sp.]|jgi:hypothetical protein
MKKKGQFLALNHIQIRVVDFYLTFFNLNLNESISQKIKIGGEGIPHQLFLLISQSKSFS